MTDNSYIKWTNKSDTAIEKDIGLYIKEIRQQQQKTQSQLAKEADISRSTLSLLERGETGTITTLIKILRVLDQLQTMHVFEINKQISPLALAKMQAKNRQRVKKKNSPSEKNTTW